MAPLRSLGKPTGATTFGDLADVYCKIVFGFFSETCKRVDVIFDAYRTNSIKAGTRACRANVSRKIRRVIDSRNVQLPSSWQNFINLSDNKLNLIHFLTNEILMQSQRLPLEQELVVAGGCENPEIVLSSSGKCMTHLKSSHEEADTRLVLHAIDASKNDFKRIIVQCRDTDVLVLLTYHQTTEEVWMAVGTAKKPRYIPVHDIRTSLPNNIIKNLPAYHAITGCDTTSQLSGHGKKSTWATYIRHPDMLSTFTDMCEGALLEAEKFVLKVYDHKTSLTSVDDLRADMFHRVGSLDKLPPKHDALTIHLKRCQHQLLIWLKASEPLPTLTSPETSGWKKTGTDELVPILRTIESMPSACNELLRCGCKTR